MSGIQGFDYEPELFNILLERLENRIISIDDAQRLRPMLEIRWRRALADEDKELADDILFTLIGLDAYIERRVSLADLNRISNVT
jgi:hypothetical protein